MSDPVAEDAPAVSDDIVKPTKLTGLELHIAMAASYSPEEWEARAAQRKWADRFGLWLFFGTWVPGAIAVFIMFLLQNAERGLRLDIVVIAAVLALMLPLIPCGALALYVPHWLPKGKGLIKAEDFPQVELIRIRGKHFAEQLTSMRT